MSYDQFWFMDVDLVRAYREADRIRQKRIDEEMWLMGMYVYQAVGSLHPLFNSLKPSDAKPYLEEPFSYTNFQEKANEEQPEEERIQSGVDHFRSLIMAVNKQRHNKESDKGGSGNS